jgi:2-oxoglutarate dehydrogenase dihydrolipoamide succinyltransferase (E2 component)
MAIEVTMPQLGESVVEGTITRWLKNIGEYVEEYEPLLEINTDKVDTEIPSPSAGILTEIRVPEGTTVQVGATLAMIDAALETAGAGAAPTVQPVTASPPMPESSPETDAIPPAENASPASAAAGRNHNLGFISPVVARIANEFGVDLTRVGGTGQGGRITKKDILAYIENQPAPVAALPEREEKPKLPPSPTPSAPALAAPAPAPVPGELLPLNAIRRAIAEHMVFSRRTSPHVSTIMEVDLNRVVAHRSANKAEFARDGVNLTYTAYFTAAAVAALKAYSIVNSSWSDEGILLHRSINIGIATSLGEAGLIVPVIKNADGLSLLGLARAVNDLSSRARQRKLQPDEVREGTFTITNHGVSGSLFAMPIINQPQCAILGIGAIQKRVVVISDAIHGDTIAIRPMAYLSLTFDHRILDGATADYFLSKMVESLQNWETGAR